jgi:hypothetical protein
MNLLNKETIGSLDKFPSGPFYHSHKSKVESTPTTKSIVEQTVECIRLIESSLANEPDVPSKALMRFLDNKQFLSTKVIERVDTLVAKVTLSREEIRMIKQMYFQVLLKMLIGEEVRLNTSDFSILLNNENFNKSLVLCAAETVLFAYNRPEVINSIDLMKLLNLEAFELSKVIESFVVHCTWLSPVFKRHMRYVEEKCFDFLSWRETSTLFERLKQESKGESVVSINSVTETPKRKPVVIVTESPVRTEKEKGKSPSLDFFFRKTFKLIQSRITEMTSFFPKITSEITESIYGVVQYALLNKPHLMMNRHLDQILICSIFAVFRFFKIGSKDLFRDLVYQYKCLCETKRSISPVETLNVVWNVAIKGSEYGDIIAFYNKCFIQEVKPYLHKEDKIPMSPSRGMQIPMSPSRKIGSNVFMSPLRTPSTPSALTPKTRALYEFGSGFTEKSMEMTGFTMTDQQGQVGIKRVLTFAEGNSKDDYIARKLSKMEEK